MKITKKYLQKVIKEELNNLLKEDRVSMMRRANYNKSQERADKYVAKLHKDPRIKSVIDNFAVALGMIRDHNPDINIPNRPKLTMKHTGLHDGGPDHVGYTLAITAELGIKRRREEETEYADGTPIEADDVPSGEINPATGRVYKTSDPDNKSGKIDPNR